MSEVMEHKLTDVQKDMVFKFCGYPLPDGSNVKKLSSWPFVQAYHQLDRRMNNLTSLEISIVTDSLSVLEELENSLVRDEAGNVVTDTTEWTPIISDVRIKTRLYNRARMKLCTFFGVIMGPDLLDSYSSVLPS